MSFNFSQSVTSYRAPGVTINAKLDLPQFDAQISAFRVAASDGLLSLRACENLRRKLLGWNASFRAGLKCDIKLAIILGSPASYRAQFDYRWGYRESAGTNKGVNWFITHWGDEVEVDRLPGGIVLSNSTWTSESGSTFVQNYFDEIQWKRIWCYQRSRKATW